jgi:NAD(P)-dependent dehydrogenase (short-subunit alcohol dehydrogenase family)
VLLEDRVAIVSGIGPGMGRDISLALARNGAHVVLGARTKTRLDEVAAEVEALGRRAVPVVTDIADEAQCDRLAATAHEQFGRIDILVNNAFYSPPFETLDVASLDTWRDSLEVNVLGNVRLTTAVVPYMKARQRGSIVFISTMGTATVVPHLGVYHASKAGVLHAARHFACELGAHGIRVNAVAPGYIMGAALQGWFRAQAAERGCTYEEIAAERTAHTALGHIPDSAEIADTVVFFASDLARVVTGQVLHVDGGMIYH